MSSCYNFCAGPAIFPEEVLLKAREDLLNFENLGTSILSISHRSDEFLALADRAKKNLRKLLAIPSNYEILFLHGGASWQAAMVPANFLGAHQVANYIDTGHWSQKAIKEAKYFGKIKVIASGLEAALNTDWPIEPNAAYCHFTPNETIDGIEFYNFPKNYYQNSPVPLIADMSSTILSRPFDVSQLDLIYAGAQKNMGPSGLSVIILNKKLLEKTQNKNLPTMMDYQVHVDAESIYNTPATFSWYLMGEFLEWVIRAGGLAEMDRRSLERSSLLYNFIDESDFYKNTVPVSIRSRMNIPFLLARPELDDLFITEAEKIGLINLRGHRVTGGMRASLYNAMPLEGVKVLISFMKEFEKRYG